MYFARLDFDENKTTKPRNKITALTSEDIGNGTPIKTSNNPVTMSASKGNIIKHGRKYFRNNGSLCR